MARIALRTRLTRIQTMPRHSAIGFIRRTAGRALDMRAAGTCFIGTYIRTCAIVAVIAADGICRVHAFAIGALHGIRTHIIIFRARMTCIALRAAARILAMPSHSAIRFIRRTASRALNRRSALTRPVQTLIRRRAAVIVTARVRIIRIHARPAHALHGIRTYIVIFRAIPSLDTLRTRLTRIQAMARDPAIRMSLRTARTTLNRRPALTHPVQTLIRRRAAVIVTAGVRIIRIHARSAHALHRIRAYIVIFRAIPVLDALRTRLTRIQTMARQPAVRMSLRTARITFNRRSALTHPV